MSNECENPCGGPGPTLCDKYAGGPNVWIEDGVCMLDTLCKDQIIYIIERSPQARHDLTQVTTCQELLDLLGQISLLPPQQEDDALMSKFNQGDCLPQYTVFGGRNNDR